MTPHYCTVCFRPVDAHDEHCDVDDCCGHWPALCCPGCACESFEQAHPELTAASPAHSRVDLPAPDEARDTGPTEPRHELAGLLYAAVQEARFWHRAAVACRRSKRTETHTIGRVLLDARIDERTRATQALLRTARGLKTLLDTHYPRPGKFRRTSLPVSHMEGCIDG